MTSLINTLYSRFQNGDTQAQEELFEQLSVRFRLFAHRKIWDKNAAEDVVQETMTVIAREITDLSIDSSFSAWAYQVLKNRILAYFKSRKVQEDRRANESDGETLASSDVNPELKQQLRECLRKIGSANQRYARVLTLHYQGYATDEICERLKVKEGNLYMLLSRARQALMACLKGDEE